VTTAFVIGNGASRTGFDLSRLKKRGTVYGCNALYREYAPDYALPDFLVAIDQGMIDEILASDFPKHRFIQPPMHERWEPKECNPRQPRSNAGINAIREAAKRGAENIVCLGFDFLVEDRDASVSNLFEGTRNYGPETRAVYEENSGRRRYLEWVARTSPSVSMYFVFPSPYVVTDVESPHDNVMKMTYDNLTEITS